MKFPNTRKVPQKERQKEKITWDKSQYGIILLLRNTGC